MNTPASTESPQPEHDFIFISDEECKECRQALRLLKDKQETDKLKRMLKEGTVCINKEGIIEKVPSTFVTYRTKVFAFCGELYGNINFTKKKSKEAVDLSDEKSDGQDENMFRGDFSLEEE